MKREVAFIHTSPAAIAPLMEFYGAAAPEIEITNLLDDGIMRMFKSHQSVEAQRRLTEMIASAHQSHGAELAMLTCSAVPRTMLEQLTGTADLPILKIDVPMARVAVRSGTKIGVVVTFPPTLEPTRRLLAEAAAEADVEIEIVQEVSAEAYRALLNGDFIKHDDLLLAAVGRLDKAGVDAVVLAQVSMARILPQLKGRSRAPVLSSLDTSLTAIREILKEQG